MPGSRLDRLFARFRLRGDPASLAQVFDGTAAELLRVAKFLARDAHGAEDLVQTTFQKAIEHRDRYDPELPVLPWLLGILANTARHERRQRGRTLPAPPERAAVGPDEVAEQAEFRARLRDALRGMPEPYREVLLLQVEHGLDTAEIAEVTGRRPATVRTQIARGMELLRRALPAGIGGAVAIVASAERGLAAVRAEVLRTMGVDGALPVGVASGVVGALAMKKVLLSVAAALLLLSSWWWFDAATVTPPESSRPVARSGEDPGIRSTVAPAADAAEAAREAAPARATSAASLVVLVRHAHGGAAAGVGVYLRAETLGPFGREATTDASGCVRFVDLPLGALAVKPDRAPPQAATLVAGTNTLDLVLPAGVDVEGRVVDPPGKVAVAGARIFAQSREHHDFAQFLTQADGEGRFTLRGVAVGTALFARAAGRQPSGTNRPAVVDGPPGGSKQMELRTGACGFRLSGRVRDAAGAPVPLAFLAVAVDEDCHKFADGLRGRKSRNDGTRPLEREAFFVRADAQGRYETDEVPEGDVLVLARAPGSQQPGIAAARVAVRAAADNGCDLVVQPGAEIFGTVRDEAGQPFAGLPLFAAWQGTLDLGEFEKGFGHLVASAGATTAADGSYRLQGLLAGDHAVQPGARIGADLGIEDPRLLRELVTLVAAESRRLDLTVARRADLRVRLLAPDGAPLAGWGVWTDTEERPTPRMATLEAQRTAADGRVVLRNQPRDTALWLTIHEPRAASAGDRLVDRFPARRWPGIRATGEELELRLRAEDLPTASLVGRFVDRHGAPCAAPLLELAMAGWQEVRRVATSADGAFHFGDLPAGDYSLRPRTPGDPPFGPFALAAGQRLDLGTIVVPAPGTLRVRLVASDAAPITKGRVQLALPASDGGNWELQRQGELFVSEKRAPGRYHLVVSGADLGPSVHDVEVREGEECTLDVRCARGFSQAFVVVLPAGAVPAPWAAGGMLEFDVFAADGSVVHVNRVRPTSLQFTLPMAAGKWTLRTQVPGFPRVYQDVQLADGATAEPIRLVVH